MAPVLPANLTQEKTAELEAEPSDQVTGAMGGVAKPITMEEVANLLSRIVAPPAAPAEPTPEKDYRGLKPIEIPSFSEDTAEYHFFRKSFEAAHNYRNLDKTTMALLLQSHLRGPASRLAQDMLKNNIDETSYDIIWDALERRYGGSYNETASITEQFNQLPVLQTLKFEDLERTFSSFELQKDYYARYDPEALINEKSLLNIVAKRKLAVPLGRKYLRWCREQKVLKNFNTIYDWLKIEYQDSLEAEREFSPVSTEAKDQECDEDAESDSELTYWAEPKDGGPKFRIDKQTVLRKKLVRFDDESSKQVFRNETKSKVLELRPTDICELCNTFHSMSKCPKFEGLCITDKKLLMRLFVLCYHCLSSQHLVGDCKVNEELACGIRGCKGLHHPLIHADKKSKNFEFDRNQFTPLSNAEKDSISHLFGQRNSYRD